MSSAVEAISCSKVDVPAGPEPEEAAKKPAEHGGDAAPNGKCGEAAAPRCHEEEEEEEDAPKVIDLGPMVSIKEQLEKDKDDESLRRWKEQLLGSVDFNSVGGSEEIVPQEYEEQEGSLYHLEASPGGVTEGGGSVVELPECPEHYPTTFIKDNQVYQGYCKTCLFPACDEE